MKQMPAVIQELLEMSSVRYACMLFTYCCEIVGLVFVYCNSKKSWAAVLIPWGGAEPEARALWPARPEATL